LELFVLETLHLHRVSISTKLRLESDAINTVSKLGTFTCQHAVLDQIRDTNDIVQQWLNQVGKRQGLPPEQHKVAHHLALVVKM